MNQNHSEEVQKKGKAKKIIEILIEFLLIVAFLGSLTVSDDPIYLFFGIGEISESLSFILPFSIFIFALISGFCTLMYIIIKRVKNSLDTISSLLLVMDLTFGTLAMINLILPDIEFGVFSILVSTYLLFTVFIYMLKSNRFMIYVVYIIMGTGFAYIIISIIILVINLPLFQSLEALTGFVIALILPVFFVWLTIQPIDFIEKEERKKKKKTE